MYAIQVHEPSYGTALVYSDLPCGSALGRVVVVVQRQPVLFEVVDALDARGGLADFLDGRQEQPNEDGNDGYDDEQLNERGMPSSARTLNMSSPPRC